MFDISLTDEAVLESAVNAVYGKIVIGDYAETFIASLVCWSPEDYADHWARALRHIAEGHDCSALITNYVPPALGSYLVWWPIYRRESLVYIHNQMLFYERLKHRFEPSRPWDFVPPLRRTDGEGRRISEWKTSFFGVQKCHLRISRKTGR